MVHGLPDVGHVGLDGLRDRLLAEVQHRVHLLIRFVHLERVLVEVRGELIQRDPLQRRLVLAFHPLLLLLFDEFFSLEDCRTHVFLAAERAVAQFHVLFLQAADQAAESVQLLHHLVLLGRGQLEVAGLRR